MSDVKISQFPYIGNTGYTPTDLLVFVNYLNPTGTTNNTKIDDVKDYVILDSYNYFLPLSGGTVTGSTTFTNGLTANTISATIYQNLPQDIFVTGGTYTNGEILFKNNSGGSFTVTGLPIGGAGGQVYYLNLSQTQTPYQEFSPIGTNLTEQTTGVTINSGVTSTIASFLTPVGYPNTTTIPAGYWSFYLHSYKDVVNASFDIFCEVYVYKTGGTETLILTTEGADVTTYSPTVSMELTDGYYSGSTIDITDRILVKVRTTNTGSQTNTITFFTEGQQHYSYGITPFSNFNDLTCETLSGCTTIVNLENNKVNKGGDTMSGTLYVPTISATTISATTVGSSGDCVDDIYVSNIHSCSPLNINPLNEGNVYFGSTSGVTIDLTNNRVGIGTSTPSEKLEVTGNTKLNGTLSINDSSATLNVVGNAFGQASLISPTGAIVLTPGLYGVQINGANPDLSVNGKTTTSQFQLTTSPASGYVLTSDSSGNSTWKTPTTFTGGTVTGSTSFTNGLTANTISATTLQSSNTYIESTGYLYFGDSSTDGSWRMSISGANFIVEKRVGGNWIISGTFN